MSTQAIANVKPAGQVDLSPQTFEQALTFSNYLADSDLVPRDYKGKPGNCLIAMQWGAEIGLKPMQALQNIAVINGRPALWGDSVIALVRSSPVCEYILEEDDGRTAICKVKRRGEPEQTRTFSMDDAKAAGLTGKQGPWTQYPKRMRQMRARAFALRDVFPDVLKGMPVAEEVMDIPKEMGPVNEVQQPAAQPAGASAELLDRAEAAAAKGVLAFREFWKATSKEEREQISKDARDRYQAIATQADAERTVDTAPAFPPMDEPVQQPAGKSFEQVMQMLCDAKTEDALYVAGDWFEAVGDDAAIKMLEDKFNERLAQIRGEA